MTMTDSENPEREDGARGTFWDQPVKTGRMPGARHARVVRSLRLGLPLLAAVIVLTVMAWPRIQTAMAPERQAAQVTKTAGRNQLLNPKFRGLDKDNEPYVVSADHAEQSLDDQNVVLLDKPKGDILMKSGHHVGMEGDRGTYLQHEKTLLTEGHVVLHEDEGYKFYTSKALFNAQTHEASSDQPVSGGGPDAAIAASGAQGFGNDHVLVFTGPAKLRLFPDPQPAVNAPPAGPQAEIKQ